MKKVVMIRFAVEIGRILNNSGDLAFYSKLLPNLDYIDVFYDGNDFLVINKTTNRKVYVAKTNVSQWELDDTERAESNAGVPKKVRTETKS